MLRLAYGGDRGRNAGGGRRVVDEDEGKKGQSQRISGRHMKPWSLYEYPGGRATGGSGEKVGTVSTFNTPT
jgi:hypothetical protein